MANLNILLSSKGKDSCCLNFANSCCCG